MDINDSKHECLIFLSWQSDRKDCRNFVNKVVNSIPNKLSPIVTVAVDRDTEYVPGSPDIGDTIFEKIDNCDLFIADITLINDKDSNSRLTPNPNVLIELGYAIKSLGWNRIILLECRDYGEIEDLPFDINHRRICVFDLKDVSKKEESKKHVVSCVNKTISLLLEKNMLFGGKRMKIPKFEISYLGNSSTMSYLTFKIRNVSSVLVSKLQSIGLTVEFENGLSKTIASNPQFTSTSLLSGDETTVKLNNEILGAGQGFNNAVWHNYNLWWQFSCEDEECNVYCYEMKRYIESSDNESNIMGLWDVKYIG